MDLKQQYQESYDLEEIEAMALELGMVPVAEVNVIRVDNTPVPQRVPEMSFWEEMRWLMDGLFA